MTYMGGLSICVYIQVFGDTYEYTWKQPTSFIYKPFLFGCGGSQIFSIMKKIMLVITLSLGVCMQSLIAQDKVPTTSQTSEKSTDVESSATTKENLKIVQDRKILDISNSNSIINQTSHKGLEFKGLLTEIKLMQRLYYLNSLDVCRYYELNEYDTDLKRKVFKETQEGGQLLNQLKAKKQEISNSKLYYIFPFSNNWGWEKEYNLKTKTFDFAYIIDEDKFLPIQGYINFPQLTIKCNPIIKQYKERIYNSNINRYSYLNTIKIPITEKAAIPIEENIDRMALVIEFKLQQMKYTSRQAAIFNLTTYCLQGISSKIYIINKITNEIYFSL